MSVEIRLVPASGTEAGEAWERVTDDPDVRGVDAVRVDEAGGWQVGVSVMEFIRQDPLESELRQRIAAALRAVDGVTGVEEEDREAWFVTGAPAGRVLAEAAAEVVDDLAGRTRAFLDRLQQG
jgi:hypothetical protein